MPIRFGVSRFGFDIDQVMRIDYGGDVAIDELAAVVVHDSWLGAPHGLERRPSPDIHPEIA
jgi:hypothetical protein